MLPIIMKNICTVFGLGQISRMPGTLGSIVGVFLGLLLLSFFSTQVVLAFFIFLLPISFYAIKIYQKEVGKSDKSEIIIDEVLGQLFVLMFIKLEFIEVILAFILFRFFDILKPFPVSYFDKNHKNYFGIIMDDIMAGLYSIIVVYLVSLIF